MKPFPAVALAGLVLAGCSLFGIEDCSFDVPPTRQQTADATIVAALPDTIVVALVEVAAFPIGGGAEVVVPGRARLGDSLSVRISLATRAAAPDAEARLDVRGDTVFVSFDAPIMRQACSPPMIPGEGFVELGLPEGVVVRNTVRVPQGPPRVSAQPVPSDLFRPLLRA